MSTLVEELRATVREWWRNPEVIGDPDCPILHRWTLFRWGRASKVGEDIGSTHERKLFLHHFVPGAGDERDPHDHPWPFVTLVLRGGYRDECYVDPENRPLTVRRDYLHVGSVRYRSATHSHVTQVGERGAWTLVLTGAARRSWGFWDLGGPEATWRGRRWLVYKKYREMYGHGMVCDTEENA